MAAPVRGQGFSMTNGRNHPELRWVTAETEHFRINYPEHLAGIAYEAASVAETTYAVLSHNLGVTFDKPIRIYLSDEDEIVNGFAVDIGNGYTNIWVHVNDAVHVWTGREKWLRKVLAHELTHLFHFRAVRSNLGTFGRVLSNNLPRFWTEGLAQYQTESWDSERGDRWLRTAVLDDKLSYSDGLSSWNGRLLYAVGNAQVRYFADRYGDSTLVAMLRHRRRSLFGIGKVHDFDAAFRAATKQPYESFYDDWRRTINLYYNTIASGMEHPDSLGVLPLRLPGQYTYDVTYSPDTTHVAVLAMTSLDYPVRRLTLVRRKPYRETHVAEGDIDGPVSWSRDGRFLAFSRLNRAAHGSLINDVYIAASSGDGLRRLTSGRRATSPSFSPDGRRIAFVASSGVTANIYLYDLATGIEKQVTHFTGDVQIGSMAWHPLSDTLAFALFDTSGLRTISLVDASSGTGRVLTSGDHDDRDPVWSPDGGELAYTSRRDQVPNVFAVNLNTGLHRRVTNLATGASAVDWLPPDSLRPRGSIVVISNGEKTRDRVFRIDAFRHPVSFPVQVPEGYVGWTMKTPPVRVPDVIPVDSNRVLRHNPYSSWRNITHGATFGLPYYDDPNDWGLIGLTLWIEPLGKHVFSFLGGISFATPAENSFFAATYVNSQWYPNTALSLYRMPGSSRFYGDELLVENYTGGEVAFYVPLDWRPRPYTATTLGLRFRYVGIDPLNQKDADELPGHGLLPPEDGRQADLRLTLIRRKQRPYRHEAAHPLDGRGIRLQVEASARVLGTDSRFLRGDLSSFTILPVFGLSRLYLYGRGQIQTGRTFVQDYIGLSRHDEIQIGIPGFIPFSFGDVERVRGYRSYAVGDRVLFGSAEYRVPVLPDLQTRLLGIVSLGATAVNAFADGAVVARGRDLMDRRLGVGLEVKNALRIGFVEIGHAVGIAQPYDGIGDRDTDVYYRIRAAVPF